MRSQGDFSVDPRRLAASIALRRLPHALQRVAPAPQRGTGWSGYKAHFTETCSTAAEDDPDAGRPPTPNLITHVATTTATVPDMAISEPIHDSLHRKDLLPGEHVVDAVYTCADLLLAARARGVTLLGPLLADTSPQARGGGYTTAAFTIDWDTRQVRCP